MTNAFDTWQGPMYRLLVLKLHLWEIEEAVRGRAGEPGLEVVSVGVRGDILRGEINELTE